MLKKILALILSLSVAVSAAHADTCSAKLVPTFPSNQATLICSTFSAGTIGTIANDTFATARNAANSANLSIWKADSSDNTHLNAGTGKVIDLDIAVTPVAALSVSGFAMSVSGAGYNYGSGFTATPVTTPVQASNYCPPGLCVIPTAAANAAVYLGASATPQAGQAFLMFNSNGTNAVRVKAGGAAKINGSGSAGNYFSLGAQLGARCEYADSSTASCFVFPAVTPAGP